jgi:hypothetical protein
MKGKLLTIGFSAILASLLMCSIVSASWSTLGTGYAVTTNIEGPIAGGTPVTVTAGTLDSTVTQVTFKWFDGTSALVYEETVAVFTNGTIGYWDEGTPTEKTAEIRYAQSTYAPYHGEWQVEVTFHGTRESSRLSLPIDITQNQSLFVVPEISLGTIGATVAMAAALGLFVIKQRRQTK